MLPKPSPLCRLCPSEEFCYLWMLDCFPWCNDSVCPRIASLELGTEDVKVEAVQLNDTLMTQYETQKEKFLLQLDHLLDDVRDQNCQVN